MGGPTEWGVWEGAQASGVEVALGGECGSGWGGWSGQWEEVEGTREMLRLEPKGHGTGCSGQIPPASEEWGIDGVGRVGGRTGE